MSKVPCKYGAKCYRKNPAHFAQYSHPSAASPPPAASPKPKKTSHGAAKPSESVALGVASAWKYRRRRAKCHDVHLEMGEDEQICERALDSKKPLRLLSVLRADIVAALDLQHGDVIDFGDYRGCGCFVVEPVDNLCSDWYLYKSCEEMGYATPLCFSDSPHGYYSETPLAYDFRYPGFAPESHFLWDEVKARQADPNYESTTDWYSPINPKRFPDDYVFFEDYINGGDGGSWLLLKDYYTQEYAGHHNFVQKRLRFRRDLQLRVARCVLGILLPKVGLMKDLAHLIATYVCAPPHVNAKDVLVLKPQQPKKKKPKKSNQDDEEWSG